MQLPDTDNIDYQYAFKKGYRMAIDGKRVTSMPSNIRRDMGMRDYFQQGWEQAVEDMSLTQEFHNKPNWRSRFIWFAFMILGGIATASLMINNIESEIAAQQALISGEQSNTTNQPTSQQNIVQKNTITSIDSNPNNEIPLSLLSKEQRKDLELTQRQKTIVETLELEPIIESSISILRAELSQDIESRTPINILQNQVPKYIRKLNFFTEVSGANGQTIYHRWRTDTQILATVKLEIESNKYKTWSSKKLSSAWLGQWYVEVLDHNQNVIYRKPFYYGNSQ
ncbi:DUF2914 domain-containing protein [Thiomicrorhabdus lithotrophica]|uniref:DUF2914 domain-containing protein n=1 Tax=Thiomicrorhabdus lithotrophica TaxID=2949997 RepID=A0ABY8C923_9GAMM|nr:DUF2914 domain-containing protein [Thiomicrorhabdus lithotrophica]WEJ62419.1 DUF2914 domain-containing protein [Thiomicrorhabdus lithotrophica]